MPVPKVSRMTTPATPRAAPKRASAMPAASASLSTVTWVPVALVNSSSASVPIQLGSTLAAERATPCWITAGKVAPERTVPAGLLDHLRDHGGDGVRSRRMRRDSPYPSRHQLTGRRVDDGALDSTAADVDAEGGIGRRCLVDHVQLLHRDRRRRGASSNTIPRARGRMVCCDDAMAIDPTAAPIDPRELTGSASWRSSWRSRPGAGRATGATEGSRSARSRRRPIWSPRSTDGSSAGSRAQLRPRRPDDGVVGEEGAADARSRGRRALAGRPDRRHRQLRARAAAVRGVGRG